MEWRDSTGMRLGPRPWVWQLFFFVGACITIVLAFQAFRGPDSRAKTVSTDEDALTAGPAVPPPRDTLADDEFRAPPPLTQPAAPRPSPRAAQPATADIDLNPVRDATLGVRFDESDAFFDLLQDAARTPPEDLEAKVRYDVQYVNLMTDPSRYRGQAITIAGELQRLTPFTAASNRHRLQTLYEAWIVTPDSSPHAYRVVTSQLGVGIPAKPARLPVQVTGYFLKQEGYVSPAGVELTPVVLGA
ncbi:MAG TPA: hypothetical protein VFG20_18025, partial [Planctomycetaceae bacterium]|nr:hypothetical protein [Planctomycetaceae bacterium]